jgi:two-component system, NarL family, response regulator NreC
MACAEIPLGGAAIPIKCVIVDDHALFRDGLRRILESESDITVIGEANDASAAMEKVRELSPDVVLMDIGMPGMSSFDAARELAREYPSTRLIFLTMYEEEEYLMQCMSVGAAGFLLKDSPAPRLVNAVREVFQGHKYLSPQILGRMVDDVRARNARGATKGSMLTPREREIVKLIAEGNSVKEIASLLGRSVKTVEAHKFNLMRKLDIHNKAQLVTYAIQKKIVKLPAEV